MPGRLIPLVNGEVYHVFNRGIDRRPTFLSKRDYARALVSIQLYRVVAPPLRLAYYLQLNKERQVLIMQKLLTQKAHVEILAYCFMPNHFHFCLRQTEINGISKFLSNFQNSYTRYFNTRLKRTGPLFLDQFKAIRIESEEQLLHLIRYIHLNPYTSFVVKTVSQLETYPWSSFSEYIGITEHLCETHSVLSQFKTKRKYKKFVLDQSDYQRQLKSIEHLLLEDSAHFT